MNSRRIVFACAEVLLVMPAALFMLSLFVRNLQPVQYEPARTAQNIVAWYAARTHLGLWIFLVSLPLVVLVTGGGALWRQWCDEPELRMAAREVAAKVVSHAPVVMVALATLAAAGFLAIVALHMASD